jgi:hypothetical protein
MLKVLYSILLILLLLLTFIRGVDAVQKPLVVTSGCRPNRIADATVELVTSMSGIHQYIFTVRGGEVIVADTPEDMDSILINANGALVVVDFWAT